MRVTQNEFYRLAFSGIQRNQQNIVRAQEQIITLRRVLRPSDDPTAARRILSLDTKLSQIRELADNREFAKRFLDIGSSTLQGVSDLLAEVRADALGGANGAVTENERRIFAQKIEDALRQLEGLVNTDFNGQYLFGGTRNDAAPFLVSGNADGKSVTYRGNREEIQAAVGPGVRTPINIPGARLFLSRTSIEARILGDTGVAPGTGGPSLRDEVDLGLLHTATVLGDGALPPGGDSASGILPGASSASGDTVLGEHTLVLTVDPDGSGGTVALDGGEAVAFTTSDADLPLENDSGDVIHLDLTGATPGFSGTVAVSASGAYTLDGGATTVPIDFADANQEIVDPATGRSLFLDGTGVERTGSAPVLLVGQSDLFQTLQALVDDLRNESGLPADQVPQRIRAHIEELDRHVDTVLDGVSELGSRSAGLDSVGSYLDQLDLELDGTRSSLRDTDLSQAAIDLARFQMALQASQDLASRILSASLTNFLR